MAKKIVKLKVDENVNFDFRIFENEKLHFWQNGAFLAKNKLRF